MCRQGSRRSDEEALEEQVRKLGEELREVRELYETEQDKTRSNDDEVLHLHNQVADFSHTQRCVCSHMQLSVFARRCDMRDEMEQEIVTARLCCCSLREKCQTALINSTSRPACLG